MYIPEYSYRISNIKENSKVRKLYDLEPVIEGLEPIRDMSITDLIRNIKWNKIRNGFYYKYIPKGHKQGRNIVEICDDILEVVSRLHRVLEDFPVICVRCLPFKCSVEVEQQLRNKSHYTLDKPLYCYKFYSQSGVDLTNDLMCLCYFTRRINVSTAQFANEHCSTMLKDFEYNYSEYDNFGFFFNSSDLGIVFSAFYDEMKHKSICDLIRVINNKLYIFGLMYEPMRTDLRFFPCYTYIFDDMKKENSVVGPIYICDSEKLLLECCLSNMTKPSELYKKVLKKMLKVNNLYNRSLVSSAMFDLFSEDTTEKLDTIYEGLKTKFVMLFDGEYLPEEAEELIGVQYEECAETDKLSGYKEDETLNADMNDYIIGSILINSLIVYANYQGVSLPGYIANYIKASTDLKKITSKQLIKYLSVIIEELYVGIDREGFKEYLEKYKYDDVKQFLNLFIVKVLEYIESEDNRIWYLEKAVDLRALAKDVNLMLKNK